MADPTGSSAEFHASSIRSLPASQVFSALGTSPRGLTQAEVSARLVRFGSNALARVERRPLLGRLLSHFTHFMAVLLWAGGLLAFAARMPQLGAAVWLVVLINGGFSFWQEYRAERAVEALRRMLPRQVRAVREGQEASVSADALVPGDLILLAEGDRIPADGRLVEDAELRVEQSTLTGEAHALRKTRDAIEGKAAVSGDAPNVVFAGTSVTAGSGKAVIFATGMRTEFGRIAHLTQTLPEEPSPLQREMAHTTRVVTALAVAAGLLFFLLSEALAGVGLAEALIFSLGMIVAFVPEGLLPTVTLALAMGVQRMARQNALVKKLSAVETLGCTTVICTDKTGTLTQNEMTVREIWLPGGSFRVMGTGYEPEGSILKGSNPVVLPAGGDLGRLLVAAGLCNNARLRPPDSFASRWTVLGDPTEAALLVAARKAGIDLEAEICTAPRVREIPFDSRRKRMATVHEARAPGHGVRSSKAPQPRTSDFEDRAGLVAFVKGAPREVLALCDKVRAQGRDEPLGEEMRTQILRANDLHAGKGLRVLAVAERALSRTQELTPDALERELTFLGLVAMMDPPRPEVSEAVEKCRRAGIRIIMITGDYGLTAESIARRIGIVSEGARPVVLSGPELDPLSEADLEAALSREVVIARASPEHKLRVVSALQRMGHVVAVTGDGVNDAPALRKADIGVAMGLTGTDVAKEAADMILADDNFASIVNAVEEGRAVFANIKKFVGYIFTSNTPEAVPFVLFALSRAQIPLALTVMQVLSIDLGTDLLPALALGAEPPEPGLMDQPPRDLREHVITPALLARSYLWLGLPQSIAAMAAFYFQFWTNGHWGQWLHLPDAGPLYRSATAMALGAVVTTQIGNLFAQRSERTSAFRLHLSRNRLLWAGIGAEIALVGAIVYAPPLQTVFGTERFAPGNWLFLIAWAPLLLLTDELRKGLRRVRERRRETGGKRGMTFDSTRSGPKSRNPPGGGGDA